MPGLSADAFETLLKWLGPDSESAASKYREIHKRLTRLFLFKGISSPEELADEVIDRVAKKLVLECPKEAFYGDTIKAFYSFSKYIYLEHLAAMREKASRQTVRHATDQADLGAIEIRHRCLERCLSQMSLEDQQLIIRYYTYPREQKSVHREQMAGELKITMNALRIRASRVRTVVGKCVRRCAQSETSLQ